MSDEEEEEYPGLTLAQREELKHLERECLSWLHGDGWQSWHRMEARHYLRSMPDEDRSVVMEMVVGLAVTEPASTVGLLRVYSNLPAKKRQQVRSLWNSRDTRDRARAIRLAAGLTPEPDPRLVPLSSALDAVRRAIKAFPDDSEVAALQEIQGSIRVLTKQIQARDAERQREDTELPPGLAA